MKNISPLLWFDTQAEEAANFYVSVFPNSKIDSVSRYGEMGPGPKGMAMMAVFNLNGKEFMALNGGGQPGSPKPQGVAFFVNCESQEEIDLLWDKLSEGGKIMQCGWLTDKFGISWNIVPAVLNDLMRGPDKEKSARVFQAMLKMVKLDIKGLQDAAEGK